MERLQHAGLNRTFVKDSLYLQRAVSRSLSSNTWQIRKYQQQKWKLPNASSSAAVNDPGEWGDDAAKTQNSGFATGSSKIEGELKNSKKTLQRFWHRYSELLERKPVFVKSMTSLVGFALGDILAQVISGSTYNLARTLRMTLFGVLMDGPVGHLWYTMLDRNVYAKDPKSNKAVVVKMLLDQLAWAPIFSCVFFAFMCCLEGRPQHTLYSIQKKLIPVLLANYAVWPIAHLINFKFVPSSQRILYINACQNAQSCRRASEYYKPGTYWYCGVLISQHVKRVLAKR